MRPGSRRNEKTPRIHNARCGMPVPRRGAFDTPSTGPRGARSRTGRSGPRPLRSSLFVLHDFALLADGAQVDEIERAVGRHVETGGNRLADDLWLHHAGPIGAVLEP